ncbi:MAG: twin-arginine translocase subunit TatC [Rhodospirillaceae bacterium]|nr:MAG: twin-arginine translocase subunit TatC [Rhodospirillaceae bacterium]
MNGAEEDKKMPLLAHLVELRARLLWSVAGFILAFLVCFYFAQPIFNFLSAPLAKALAAHRISDQQLMRVIYTDVTEVFFTQVKVAAFGALCLSFPVIATQVWLFVAPGLYKQEKKAFLPFLVATPLMFLAGASFMFKVILPLALNFFLSYQHAGGDGELAVQLEAKVGEYVGFIMKMVFAFGFCFELPVLLTLLAKVGLVTSDGLKRKRRYAIVIVFIAAAVVTPPDVFSQVSLAVPLLLLYEVSIWLARMVEKDRAKISEDGDSDDDDAGTEVTPA